MIAQSVGGHQAVNHAPAWVGNALHPLQQLGIAGQAPVLGLVQAVAGGSLAPILRQGKLQLLGQGRQSRAALLTAATGGGIGLQHLHQQSAGQGFPLLQQDTEPAHIGLIGRGPGGATAGRIAAAAGVGEESPFKGLEPLQPRGRSLGATPVAPVKTLLAQGLAHPFQLTAGLDQPAGGGLKAQAQALHPLGTAPWAGKGSAQGQAPTPPLQPQGEATGRQAVVLLAQLGVDRGEGWSQSGSGLGRGGSVGLASAAAKSRPTLSIAACCRQGAAAGLRSEPIGGTLRVWPGSAFCC